MKLWNGSELERQKIPRWQRLRKEPVTEGQSQERVHVRRAVTRKEAKGKRKEVREKPEHVGLVASQATLQRGVEKEATTTCTPLMKVTVKSMKKQLTMRKIRKRGVCQKKVKMSSARG